MSDSSSDKKPRLYENQFAKEAKVWSVKREFCSCGSEPEDSDDPQELLIHLDVQDTDCAAWHRLLELIDRVAEDGREEFSPAREMDPEDWRQIVTLPPSIAKLKSVKRLILYGSNFSRVPPEIGEMSSLCSFDPYTSYRLHWFPYEITRCKNLSSSRVSTRALYGNYSYRMPFPKLPQLSEIVVPKRCSVCSGPFENGKILQAWISLLVATDVLPLLVHACSEKCLDSLPETPDGYVSGSHRGGLDLVQPPNESKIRELQGRYFYPTGQLSPPQDDIT